MAKEKMGKDMDGDGGETRLGKRRCSKRGGGVSGGDNHVLGCV